MDGDANIMKREYICQKHDYVLKLLTDIRNNISATIKYYSDDTVELISLLDNIDSDLYDVIYEIDEAKECGKKMEARLSKYREAIENLGFIRNN